jgi:hypothetical protein
MSLISWDSQSAEANSHPVGKEVRRRLSWNTNIHFHFQKSPPLVPVLSQVNPLHTLTHCFIHSSVICQTTGPQPLPKRFLHLMRSRASSFKWEYPLLSPRSFRNCLRLLPRLLVTSIRPFIFPVEWLWQEKTEVLGKNMAQLGFIQQKSR